METNTALPVATELLREKIRNYSRAERLKLRANLSDSIRFGLGEIKARVKDLDDLTAKDVCGLAARIKRRKHATVDDMYRLSHAFLQGLDNIRTFANIPGAIQVIVKELSGNDSERQISASECLCNLSLGEPPVCLKIVNMAGIYIVIYLDSIDESLKRTSLWTIANILAQGTKCYQILMQMALLPKLWSLYINESSDSSTDFSEDAAICLYLISLQANKLLKEQDRSFIMENFTTKNPTRTGGEYHLQIIFNCDIINPDTIFNEEQLLYLINTALSNIKHTKKFDENADRLRIVYAIRVLGNLLPTQAKAYNIVLQQLSTIWQTNLSSLLNQLFALRNDPLTKELLWLVNNFLQCEKIQSNSIESNFVNNLKVYYIGDLQSMATDV